MRIDFQRNSVVPAAIRIAHPYYCSVGLDGPVQHTSVPLQFANTPNRMDSFTTDALLIEDKVVPLPEEFPKLTHPPLSEALADIRLRDELPAAVLTKFVAPKGFPVSKEIRHGQFQVMLDKDKPIQTEVLAEGTLGRRYERDNGSEVIQLRRNGLTYSILKNYQGWDVLREATRKAWQDFLVVSGSVSVSRLAVRYINQITIPLGADYDEYLTTGPRVPKSVPPIVTGFIQRVLVPFQQDSATAIITQTLEVPAPAVLDIDVFTESSLLGSSDEIWARLDKLRNIADRIFFSSLTEKVIRSYL